MLDLSAPWIVLNLAPATAEAWQDMLAACRAHLDEGLRPLIVSQALAQTPELLRQAFAGLEIEELREYEAELHEGLAHRGRSALIDLVARKPG